MNYLRRLTLFLTTTRVSTIAVVVALYHILEFALWFGSYSTGTLTLVDLMRCRNENVTTCGASYDSNGRHFRILCKPDCQYIDIKECAKLDITYNAWSNTYRALDEGTVSFSIIDKCLDIARAKRRKGNIVALLILLLSPLEAFMSILTAVVVLLLVRVN